MIEISPVLIYVEKSLENHLGRNLRKDLSLLTILVENMRTI